MVREVMRIDGFRSPLLLARPPIIAYQCRCAAALSLSFGKPTVTFRATDKILRNLLRRFPFRYRNSVPVATFVIDEHMRTGTLNS
jgi:hypothetical protein